MAGSAILCLIVPRGADAQIAGAPVFHSLKHDPRWSIHIDYGDGARALDGITFIGARISHALASEAEQGALRLSLIAGRTNLEGGPSAFALGATAGLALRMRRLLQFEAQAGLGRTEDAAGGTQIDVPLGIAIGAVASLPDLWFTAITSRNPQFWLAPRLHVRFADPAGAEGMRVRAGFGAGGGMEFRAQNGFGVQFVWERAVIRDALLEHWRTEGAFGVSVFYSWI